ncbi:MAG TPA: helix-turn-helix transcriptional regulator [Polyangia bacterium]|nr:helix-turn-helix transcriptional regulator [Polyangia bacterium]
MAFLHAHGFPQAVGLSTWSALAHAMPRPLGLALVDLAQEDDGSRAIGARVHALWPDATVAAIGTPLQLAARGDDADAWIETSDSGRRLAALAAAVMRGRGRRRSVRARREVERRAVVWRQLTPRQRQVLGLLGCGVENKTMAASLGISERAVKAHVSALLDRFKADSRTELAVIACLAGFRSANRTSVF